eukprot:TRINITY_DN4331_c0_g1_i1.p1 TRINITY_DN4331_c0_g1~~TRINITY_DN4331_c0_g1_i1.p1  ORF type:complete len:528 (+),score=160.95 TRINITY_DN4331_c0_g1_i1:213-1796(+)
MNTREFLNSLKIDKETELEFDNYLRELHSDNNLRFWIDINYLLDQQDLKDEDLLNRMKSVIESSIDEKSNNEIGIDGALKMKFIDAYTNKNVQNRVEMAKLFKSCKSQVERLMITDIHQFQTNRPTKKDDFKVWRHSSVETKRNEIHIDTKENKSNSMIEKIVIQNFNILNTLLELAFKEKEEKDSSEDIGILINYLDRKSIIIKFFDWIFKKRVQSTMTSNEIMRIDGIDTKFLKEIDIRFFAKFAKKILKKPIKKILSDPKSFSLENSKTQTNVFTVCDLILSNIENSIEVFPPYLAEICKILKKRSMEKFGGDGKNAIISFFFLRMIQKGICYPESYSIVERDKTSTSEIRGGLLTVSKLIKNIVCGVEIYEDESQDFEKINQYISNSKNKVDSIFEKISLKISRFNNIMFSSNVDTPKKKKLSSNSKKNNKFSEMFLQYLPRVIEEVEKFDCDNKEILLFDLNTISNTRGNIPKSFSSTFTTDFNTPPITKRKSLILLKKSDSMILSKSYDCISIPEEEEEEN